MYRGGRNAVTARYDLRVESSKLDNPIWASLCTCHREVAVRIGKVARYPREVAPFFGAAASNFDADAALESLVAPGEVSLWIGVMPRVSDAWKVEQSEILSQLVCAAPCPRLDGPEIIALDATRRDDVLALIGLVYPHYFRPRTMELGRYFGVYRGDRLAAMAGERMATDAYVELSGICTHPDFTRLGYAHRLIAFLTNDLLARGKTPFLHVSNANPHAKSLYQDVGYRVRAELPFFTLRRAGAILPCLPPARSRERRCGLARDLR